MLKMDREKYKIIIHYIANEYNARLGKTQLYKSLFYIDKDYATEKKQTFTGDVYIKNNYGPTPKVIESILLEMKAQNLISFVKRKSEDGHDKQFFDCSN